eukprot:gene7626-15612_t
MQRSTPTSSHRISFNTPNLEKLNVSSDRFVSFRHLGEGTYGEVWKAYDLMLKKDVAVKKFKDLHCKKLGFSSFALREITFLKSLNHDNLANLIDVIHEKETPYGGLLMIMELEDMDLDKWLVKNKGDVQLCDCKTILHQVLQGCNHLHSQRVIHRDIKPDNILMNERTLTIKIADLGMARLYDKTGIRDYSSSVQALWFRAPEILLGQTNYSENIDVWSIGSVFGEMLNEGTSIFTSSTDIEQILEIFTIFGTPSESCWPSLAVLPHFQSVFPVWKPNDSNLRRKIKDRMADPIAIHLLRQFLLPDPHLRISCHAALDSPFFFNMIPTAGHKMGS